MGATRGAGSDARLVVDGATRARLDAARAVSGNSENGGGDGVTGATVDASRAVSVTNVDGGGDGVTGATMAV